MVLNFKNSRIIYWLTVLMISICISLVGVIFNNYKIFEVGLIAILAFALIGLKPYQLLMIFSVILPLHGTLKMFIKFSFMSYWKEAFIAFIFIKAVFDAVNEKRLGTVVREYYRYYIMIFLFFVWSILVFFWSYNYSFAVSLTVFTTYIIYMLVSVVITLSELDELRLKKIIFCLSLGSLFVALTIIIEAATGIKFSNQETNYLSNSSIVRPSSSIGTSLGAGHFLGAMTPIILYYMYFNKSWKKVIGIISFAMLAIAIMLSTVRAAMVTLFVGFLLVFMTYKVKNKAIYIPLIIGILVGAFAFLSGTNDYLSSTFIDRIASIFNANEEGNYQRIQKWAMSLNYFFESPIMGYGYGFGGNVPTFFAAKSNIFIAESWPLRLLVEIGLVGCILWYLPIVYTIIRGIRKLDEKMKPIFISLILVLISSMMLQIFENFAVAYLLWALVGMLLVSKNMEGKKYIDTQ